MIASLYHNGSFSSMTFPVNSPQRHKGHKERPKGKYCHSLCLLPLYPLCLCGDFLKLRLGNCSSGDPRGHKVNIQEGRRACQKILFGAAGRSDGGLDTATLPVASVVGTVA